MWQREHTHTPRHASKRAGECYHLLWTATNRKFERFISKKNGKEVFNNGAPCTWSCWLYICAVRVYVCVRVCARETEESEREIRGGRERERWSSVFGDWAPWISIKNTTHTKAQTQTQIHTHNTLGIGACFEGKLPRNSGWSAGTWMVLFAPSTWIVMFPGILCLNTLLRLFDYCRLPLL